MSLASHLPDGLDERIAAFLGAGDLRNLSCTCSRVSTWCRFAKSILVFGYDKMRNMINAFNSARGPTELKELAVVDVNWFGGLADEALLDTFINASRGRLRGLEVLDLEGCLMDDRDFARMLRLLGTEAPALRSLRMPEPQFIDMFDEAEFAQALASLQSLEELRDAWEHPRVFSFVVGAATASEGFRSRLRRLDLSGVGDSSLIRHAEQMCAGNLRNLQILRLSTSTEGAEAMSPPVGEVLGAAWRAGAFDQLQELCLSNPRPADVGVVEALARAWKLCPPERTKALKVLQLKGLFVCFHGSMDLVSAFKPPYFSLEVLHLGDNLVGDIGLIQLGAALGGGFGAALKELDLSLGPHVRRSMQSTISAEGIQQLCTGLAKGKVRLRMLSLGGQYIHDEGAEQLGVGFSKGALSGLEDLELRENALTDEGVASMVSAGLLGGEGSQLVYLGLERNSVTGQGFAGAAGLRRLNLTRNPVDLEGLRRVLGALAPTLRRLWLGLGTEQAERNDEELMWELVRAAGALRQAWWLDLSRWVVSREVVGALGGALAAGLMPRLCGLELTVERGVNKEARAELTALLRRARPTFDFLSVESPHERGL